MLANFFLLAGISLEKINAVLVLLDTKKINQALSNLNFAKVNLIAVIVEDGRGAISIGNRNIPIVPFAAIQNVLDVGKNFVWLISGFVNNCRDLWKTKKFLMNCGVPENNIVNFELMISTAWIANLRYVEKYGADFFATGISYTEVGLDLNFIPHAHGRGVNLSGSNQDLEQGYLTAKYVFEHVKPGTIKFVIIGLAPYSFRYNNAKAFAVCSRNLQYMLALNIPEQNIHDRLLKNLVNDNVKKLFTTVTAEQADLNFTSTKTSLNRTLPVNALVDWEDELKNLTKKLYPDTVEKNFRILKDYIKLCLDNGAKPIGVVFPFAQAMHDNYSKELLTLFRLAVHHLEESYDFTCVDLFDMKLGYDCFYNMTHLNLRGSEFASSLLGLRLYEKNLLPIENFCDMSYDYFEILSTLLPKDNYNALMERVFAKSVEKIRRKDKIKVGFVIYTAAMWCGDALYNLFAHDDRFETTVFLCFRKDQNTNKLVEKDFMHGLNQFKSRGLNVVAVTERDAPVPAQDVLFFLTPYFFRLPDALQLSRLTAKTLVIYLPYGFQITGLNILNIEIRHIAWRIFFETKFILQLNDQKCRTGMPRALYSGFPKLDALSKDADKLKFDWKMVRPDAKKIIWAPHHSIKGTKGAQYATFQYNYQFMYDFAKSHPEISWVVKPHPELFYSAVKEGIFPSEEAFNEYLQKWNDLPNAQVYAGAYYQAVFATSDGIILDSASFVSEYQYTHNPMIFLTRDTQEFNDFGKELMKRLYRVDGRDLNAIAALMQKVFIDGDDPMFKARKKFFDEHMNYLKANGMTASEFVYKNVAGELNRLT